MRSAAGLIGKDENSRGTQVFVVLVEELHVVGSEKICHRKTVGIEFHHAVAVSRAPRLEVVTGTAGFAGLEKDIVILVGGDSVASLPDRSQSVLRRGIEGSDLPQSGRVVRQYPPGGVVIAGIRAKRDIDDAVQSNRPGRFN